MFLIHQLFLLGLLVLPYNILVGKLRHPDRGGPEGHRYLEEALTPELIARVFRVGAEVEWDWGWSCPGQATS